MSCKFRELGTFIHTVFKYPSHWSAVAAVSGITLLCVTDLQQETCSPGFYMAVKWCSLHCFVLAAQDVESSSCGRHLLCWCWEKGRNLCSRLRVEPFMFDVYWWDFKLPEGQLVASFFDLVKSWFVFSWLSEFCGFEKRNLAWVLESLFSEP